MHFSNQEFSIFSFKMELKMEKMSFFIAKLGAGDADCIAARRAEAALGAGDAGVRRSEGLGGRPPHRARIPAN